MQYDLTYNIAEENLQGMIGAMKIDCPAGSGGRAGTKSKEGPNWFLANNPFAVGVNSLGPLPMGGYWLTPHETDPHMVRLNPFPQTFMHGRSGFLIHGRGKLGSHGCIVPYDFHNVLAICAAVSHAVAAGQKPTLQVVAISGNLDNRLYRA